MNVSKVVQVLPFNGTIRNYGSIIQCSDSYEFVFCTLECLHILEPLVFSFNVDSPSPVSVQRAVIEAPESVLQFDFGVDRIAIQNLQTSQLRDEVYEFMLDRTLSPVVKCSPSYKGFGEVAWSPLGLGSFGTCALAALTMDHRLTIYVKGSKDWLDVVELSDIFYEYLKANDYLMPWITGPSIRKYKSEILQDLWSKSYATAAVKMTWSHILGCGNSKQPASSHSYEGEEPFAILAVGMKNGCVVLWKASFPIKSSADFTLATVFDSNLGTISALHWIDLDSNSGYMIIGGKTGQICMCKISADMGIVTVSPAALLWTEADRIEVFQIASIKMLDETFYIVAGKGNFILAWETCGSKIISQNHTIGKCIQPITGLFADKDSFIASSGDGTLIRIYITKDDSGLSISINEILKNIQDKNFSYSGLCCSPNKMIFCIVQSISCFYDHLAIREPLNLIFATNKTIDETVLEILALTESGVQFSYFNDILHYICYCWLEHKELPDVFVPLLEIDAMQLSMETIPKLQLLRWLLRVNIFGEQDDEKATHCKSQMDRINALLIKHQLVHLLRKVDRENILQLFISDMPHSHWIEVTLLACQWVNNYYGELDEGERKLVDVLFKQANSGSEKIRTTAFTEVCRLCNQLIPLESIHFGKCSNGHSFGRCCLSLALCDRPNYKKCPNCTVLASIDACDFLQSARCPFCSRIF